MKSFCCCFKLETGGIASCYFAIFLGLLDLLIAGVLLYAWFTGELIFHNNNHEYEKLIYVMSCINVVMAVFVLIVALQVRFGLRKVTAEGVPFKSIIHHTNLLKKLYIYFFTSMIFYKLYILMHAFREYDLTIFYAVALVISVLCLYFMLLLQYIATKLQNNLHMSELQAE